MIAAGVNCLHPILINVKKGTDEEPLGLIVPCGHCISCKMRRTREWTLRLIMESKYWKPDDVQFITLTYDDDHLNYRLKSVRHIDRDRTLMHRDVQLFMKRLRKNLDYKCKFYCVGEYGTRFGRPHYHMVLFGLRPGDVYLVEKCWKNGYTLTKNFYKETAGYVAGYIQKKLFGNDAYGVATPPYLSCSQGLGQSYFMDNIETICKQGFIVFDGYKYPIPRIFARKAVSSGYLPEPDLEEIQLVQNLTAQEFYEWCERNNIKLSDYERNFRLIQENHFKRQNITRDLSEVF